MPNTVQASNGAAKNATPPMRRTLAMLEDRLRSALESNGQRFTKQRLLVYMFLSTQQEHGIHPTAEEVFVGVRPSMASISLATIYKALDVLESCGLIQKLAIGGTCAHYDFRTDEHIHARDLRTGRIIDIEGTLDPATLLGLKIPPGYNVVRCHVELEGYFDGTPS